MNEHDILAKLKLVRSRIDTAIEVLVALDLSGEIQSPGVAAPVQQQAAPPPVQPVRPARAPKTNGAAYACEKCHRTFKSAQPLGKHRKSCNGTVVDPGEAKRAYQRAWQAKRKKKLQQSDKTDEADLKPPVTSPSVTPALVRCQDCGDRFQNAKEMGIHRTRVHFGVESEHRRGVS